MSAARLGREGVPPIKSLMTPFPYSVDGAEPLGRAREMMIEHGIRHLPVKSGKRLVGVVSDRDLELAAGAAGAEGEPAVGAVAVEAFVVDLSARTDRVLRAMADRHLGAALIVKDERLAGIFTVTDACRILADVLSENEPPTGGEDAA